MKRNLEVRPTPSWHMPLIVIGSMILMNATVTAVILAVAVAK